MEDELETTKIGTPIIASDDRSLTRLCQVTVSSDDQISAVNKLLAEGWRLVSIGQRADATVYILGRVEDKPKHRTGFIARGEA